MLFENVDSRRQLSWQPVWSGLWLATSSVGLYLHPDPSGHGTHQQLGLPPCPSALIFDRPCPGCGLTTSWSALLHGQWAFAFRAHPLGPILYGLFTLSAVMALYGFVRAKRLNLTSVGMSRFLFSIAFIFMAFGITRMIRNPHFRTAQETELLTSARS